MKEPQHLLTDDQMTKFIAHGYVTVTPDLPSEFHDEVFARHEEVFAKEGNPGNNLLPRIPMIGEVFDDPVVRGTLISVVGDDYYLQPHRHPHHNPAHSKGQNIHQDGGRRWSHHTRYLLAFYYPQDTPLERGPSGIVPGSHYFNTPEGARADDEMPLVTPAGTVTIVDYDLWHRAMPNLSGKDRFMVKFLFARMSEPQTPSWNNSETNWPGYSPTLAGDEDKLTRMYTHVWHWYRGDVGSGHLELVPNDQTPSQLVQALESDHERDAIAAAYELAVFGEQTVPLVAEKLADESEMTRRHACYTLSAIGSPSVPALVNLLDHEMPLVRATAAEVLGDIGLPATAAIQPLIEATKDKDSEVRRYSAEALGTVCQSSPEAVPALIAALTDEEIAVRRAATFAMARLGECAAEAVESLQQVFGDDDRYVHADALHALRRIGTPAAQEALIQHLMPARWCPLTTAESTF